MTLEVHDLRVEFPTRRGTLRALDGISFSIAPGSWLVTSYTATPLPPEMTT